MTTLRNDDDDGLLEMDEDGHTVFADYRRDAGRLLVDHVEAPPALRGTGAAGRFMTVFAEFARSEGLKIVPICGYAARWLHASAAYRDLIAG